MHASVPNPPDIKGSALSAGATSEQQPQNTPKKKSEDGSNAEKPGFFGTDAPRVENSIFTGQEKKPNQKAENAKKVAKIMGVPDLFGKPSQTGNPFY